MTKLRRRAAVVHLGDFHSRQDARQPMRLRVLDDAIQYGTALPDLALWLWPGDLLHARSAIEDRNQLAERLVRMAEAAPVVVVYGNHDLPGDLDIFARIAARHPVHVYAQPRVERVRTALAGVDASVFALPYPTEAGLASLGTAPGLVPQAARPHLEALFQAASGALRADLDTGAALAILAGHVNVSGSVASTGQPSIGQEIELDQALLDLLPPETYAGLNHIHRAQWAGRAAKYAGSLCRLSWGEVEPKSFTVVQWDPGLAGQTVAEVDVSVPPMYHVEGEMGRAGFDWHVTDGPDGAQVDPPPHFRRCEVRARMRYRQREGVVLADMQERVRRAFEEMGCERFEFEPVCVPDRGLRAPEVAAARTLPEKLAAWARVADVVLPQDAAARIAELESREPAAVLEACAARLLALAEPEGVPA